MDSPAEEGDAAAYDLATRNGGSPPASSHFFPFCLYRGPRIADANAGLGAREVARLLATEWRRLPDPDRVVCGCCQPPGLSGGQKDPATGSR